MTRHNSELISRWQSGRLLGVETGFGGIAAGASGAAPRQSQRDYVLLGDLHLKQGQLDSALDGGRDRTKPLTESKHTGKQLNFASHENNDSQHFESELLNDFIDDHRQTRSRTADL